jgi:ribose transport system ATP-binding protein
VEFLEVNGITKTYGSMTVVDDVSLTVKRGEIVGLVGENGAGKTTLLKVLTGLERCEAGSIWKSGKQLRLRSPSDAAAAGIGIVQQEQSILLNLNVGENIMLGSLERSSRFGVYSKSAVRARAQEVLSEVGLTVSPETPADLLSFAERQFVEIARALYVSQRSAAAPLLVLDEPTSMLEGREVESVFRLLERIRALGSVIFVSHRLEEVFAICDRCYVLRDGRCVAEMARESYDYSTFHSLMVGRSGAAGYYFEDLQEDFRAEEPVLELDRLELNGWTEPLSLTVHAGEVVGLAGVVGSGREELCRAVGGAEAVTSGEMRVEGRSVSFKTPADAVRCGVGYVSSERRAEGIIAGLSVLENMMIGNWEMVKSGPFVVFQRAAKVAGEWIARLSIKTKSSNTKIERLSGGNQQKVMMARHLVSTGTKLLILDHPARGVDIGAKADIYRLIRGLASAGVGMLLVGDSLDEMIGLSHRVIVMRDRQITGVFDAGASNKPASVDVLSKMV